MKKSLTALAVLSLFGSAYAANVTVYGVVDTGLAYTHDKVTGSAVTTDSGYDLAGLQDNWKDDSFRMDSGNHSATRFGLKGSEDLGNGMTVGFVLENGFDSDTGAMTTDGKIFDREATLSLGGNFGKVYLGRMSTLISDTGSVGFYGKMASSFGSGWSDNIAGHTAVMANYQTRYNNTIAYVSPEFSGVTFFAQYAMGDTEENKHTDDRYAALGAEWKAGAFDVGVLVDWLDKDASKEGVWVQHDPKLEDQYTFNLAASYDCGFAKTFLAAQYFKDARDAGSILDTIGFFDADFYDRDTEEKKERAANFSKAAFANTGYGLHLSTTFDALGGTWLAGVGYMDADIDYAGDGTIGDMKAYTVSVGYEYSLSKRTMLYTGAGFVKRDADFNSFDGSDANHGSWEQKSYDFIAGLVHNF